MTTVLPVKGLRFNNEAGLDLSKLITPPYDVITDKLQNECYEKSPYNVIRLEYSKSLPGDNHRENKYTRAAAVFREWIKKGILIKDEKPAFYLYEQHFFYSNKKYIRKGLFCGVGLSPFEEGKIIPHEETLSNPKADRLELLRHCETNFSPIFGLFKDKDNFLDIFTDSYKEKQDPVITFEDDDGQLHKVWVITDHKFIEIVKDFFRDKKIYIADGHHRYETALQFYLEKKELDKSKEKYDHTLMALVNIYDEGLLAFPTHRIITQSEINSSELLEKLAKYFFIQEFPGAKNREELLALLDKSLTGATKAKLSFGLYTPERKLFILTLKEITEEKKLFPWLDTVVLQELVLSDIFGLGETERRKESRLVYLRDEWEAKLQVDQGQIRFAFFINRPPLEEIISLAEKGIRMPQKSTYFFPKFVTGLIMLQLGNA
ncbi:MAG: DUF1015 domain-containing protein [Dethiobacter sp.]|jgi:uncharacterized protein (DUF1015 family)|nr:MAG: DUF1015 domain-containing protein [Dethiobacter sp.]